MKTLKSERRKNKLIEYKECLIPLITEFEEKVKETKKIKKNAKLQKEIEQQDYILTRSEMGILRKNKTGYTSEVPRIATNSHNLKNLPEELQKKVKLGKRYLAVFSEKFVTVELEITEGQRNACYHLGIAYNASTSYRGRWRYTDYHYISVMNYDKKVNYDLKKKLKKMETEIKNLETLSLSPEEFAKNFIQKNEKKNSCLIALYNLNKIAKANRDKGEKLYNECYQIEEGENEYGDSESYSMNIGDSSQHRRLHESTSAKQMAYELKNEFLNKFIEKYNIKAQGYHEFADEDRDYYIIDNFSFHKNEKNSEKNLGKIENYISSKKEKVQSLSIENCKTILRMAIA